MQEKLAIPFVQVSDEERIDLFVFHQEQCAACSDICRICVFLERYKATWAECTEMLMFVCVQTDD